jgi:hypothetical protein
MWRRAQKLLSTELRTDVRAVVPLEEAPQAVEAYAAEMTGGKFLLKPEE